MKLNAERDRCPSSRPKAAAAGRLDLAGGTAGAGIKSAMAAADSDGLEVKMRMFFVGF